MINKIISGKKVYIFTKLYNIFDRLNSLELCEYINECLLEIIGEKADYCFLPYRDSNCQIAHLENKTKAIFDLDKSMLDNACILTGYLDGPAYDSGIGFELGYSFIRGIPIVVLSTDYFLFTNRESDKNFSISVLLNLISKVIAIRACDAEVEYRKNIDAHKNIILGELRRALKEISSGGYKINNVFNYSICEDEYDLYIDSLSMKYEYCLNIIERVITICKNLKLTYYISDFSNEERAIESLNCLKKSKYVFIQGDNNEMDLDSSILQGISYALEKKIILYCSNNYSLFQSKDFHMKRNPMIEHSTDIIITKIDELEAFLTT